MIHLGVLLVTLVGLWWGTEIAVKAALRIAESRGWSHAFVGMTILAIGTDVPELVMAVAAGISRLQGVDASGVVIGSAIGSCLGQIGLVLGIAGLFGYLTLGRKRVVTDGTLLFVSLAVLSLICGDGFVSRIEGGVLLLVYGACFMSIVGREGSETKQPTCQRSIAGSLALCAAGLLLVMVCSHQCVQSAVKLSEVWGLGQTVVGILLVGLGSSLPELALSLGAIRKKAGALSVGNIIGSNLFDTLVPVGAAAVIAGVDAGEPRILRIDIPALLIITAIACCFFLKKKGLQKGEAAVLLILYLSYVVLRILA